ncbi:probable phospholipid-transporting ATPase NEO1 [Trichinella spiralis]|uniref:probable phospholipid-transporting ATPase NEO1 n=1 Tax=Trichinella spiralis TaxID=6334 RepID=UPI0001EFF070|nr:probable phospholipid-transporting ATPase NEO1 [Trichinella spiralis]
MFFITLCREGYDDLKRFKRDRELNQLKYQVLRPGGREEMKSSELVVGDVINVHKNQRIPADMVLLRTSDKTGTCFIRTDQLDGETDWKLRIACPFTQNIVNEMDFFRNDITVYAAPPNKDIHTFHGLVEKKNNPENGPFVLNVDNVLWTDTVLATGSITGVVVYTGKETQSYLKASSSSSKSSSLEHDMNIITIFSFLLILRINLDLAKIFYAYSVSADKSNPGLLVRNSAVTEDLGRVSYMLCDKTGTLTQNCMLSELLAIAYRPTSLPEDDEHRKHAQTVREALEAIVICNNVTPTDTSIGSDDFDDMALKTAIPMITDEDYYQASSPDETALVHWARKLNVILNHRDIHQIQLIDPFENERNFKILQVFPFTSERKRMSIIVQDELTKEICLYSKGADIVIQRMVEQNDWLEEEVQRGNIYCSNLSREGLRTLAVARRVLSQQVYNEFAEAYKKAQFLLTNRNSAIEAALAKVERDMKLLCVTGVEDLLQKDVTVTLELLKSAGIKIWMLTGDKLETAMCVAKLSGLVNRNHRIVKLSPMMKMEEVKAEFDTSNNCSNKVLVISGEMAKVRPISVVVLFVYCGVTICLERYLKQFFGYCENVSSVICFRCSPAQKAAMVRMIKGVNKSRVVAAVGDGGNDVAMITASNAGIGIVGKVFQIIVHR